MLCFILFGNDQVRILYNMMSNDCLMSLYVSLAIYFYFRQRIYVSAFFVAVALSITSGTYLIIPAFLACTLYQYGLLPSLVYFTIIILFQLVIALPLYFTPAALLMGFEDGAQTSLWDYLVQSSLITWNTSNAWAPYDKSVFWVWLGQVRYEWNICFVYTI